VAFVTLAVDLAFCYSVFVCFIKPRFDMFTVLCKLLLRDMILNLHLKKTGC